MRSHSGVGRHHFAVRRGSDWEVTALSRCPYCNGISIALTGRVYRSSVVLSMALQVTGYERDDKGSIPQWLEFLSLVFRWTLRHAQTSVAWVLEAISPGNKTVYVRSKWSFTSTTQYFFMVWWLRTRSSYTTSVFRPVFFFRMIRKTVKFSNSRSRNHGLGLMPSRGLYYKKYNKIHLIKRRAAHFSSKRILRKHLHWHPYKDFAEIFPSDCEVCFPLSRETREFVFESEGFPLFW
jgi:hypothetical protein